jgi:hypothetical protein
MHGWLLVCKAIQAQTEHSITFHFNTPMMLWQQQQQQPSCSKGQQAAATPAAPVCHPAGSSE